MHRFRMEVRGMGHLTVRDNLQSYLSEDTLIPMSFACSEKAPCKRSNIPLGEEDVMWFFYFSRRMSARWRVRRFMKLYVPFLSRPSQCAFMPGGR